MRVEQLVDQRAAAAAHAARAAPARHVALRARARLDRAPQLTLREALAMTHQHERSVFLTKMKINVVFIQNAKIPLGNDPARRWPVFSGAVASRFDRDTEAHPLGNGAYEVRIDPGWWT